MNILPTMASGSRVPDPSNGWESVAATFISDCRRSHIGVQVIADWVGRLPAGSTLLDLGCGPGGPRSEPLHDRGTVFAVDASPTLARAYRERFPAARVACEPAEQSGMFGMQFDGVLACGLIFLLSEKAQREVISRVGSALKPGGSFLFSAPWQTGTWQDVSTGRTSLSLGLEAYLKQIATADLKLTGRHVDEGENHYYEAGRP